VDHSGSELVTDQTRVAPPVAHRSTDSLSFVEWRLAPSEGRTSNTSNNDPGLPDTIDLLPLVYSPPGLEPGLVCGAAPITSSPRRAALFFEAITHMSFSAKLKNGRLSDHASRRHSPESPNATPRTVSNLSSDMIDKLTWLGPRQSSNFGPGYPQKRRAP